MVLIKLLMRIHQDHNSRIIRLLQLV